MPSRSAPTATTRAPYAGSAAGVEQRLEVGAGAGDEHDERARGSLARWSVRGSRRARTCGAATRSWPGRRAGRRCRSAVIACTSTSNASGPTSRIRPGPDRAAGHGGEHAEQRRRRARRRRSRAARPPPSAPSGGAAGPSAAPTAADERRHRDQARRPAGVGPLSGSAASSGNIGSGPSDDQGRRDQRAGADREAGAEQVGPRRRTALGSTQQR